MRLIALIIAGEAAFLMPFVLPRIFRPTVLEIFDLTNFQLGVAFSMYGIVAMVAYLAGGPLADRFPPRHLLAIALTATAAGGIVLLRAPSVQMLVALYAYWGITTIALFWSPLIKATRQLGGQSTQGRAFGLLDGGRGLLAAGVASGLVWLFGNGLSDPDTASYAERRQALLLVITVLIALTLAAGACAWLALGQKTADERDQHSTINVRQIFEVAALPTVWLQALIIICAYVGFKATDDFSLYANEVLGMNQVDAAAAGTVSLWVRPVAAIAAGFLADRFGTVRMTLAAFVLLAAGSTVLATGLMVDATDLFFLTTIVATSLGIFALRGLYFAIMRSGGIPLAVTGSAVGLVSFLGYTPDVFMGPLMGYLLDASPGAAGHQHVFAVVAAFALLGLAATLAFRRAASRL